MNELLENLLFLLGDTGTIVEYKEDVISIDILADDIFNVIIFKENDNYFYNLYDPGGDVVTSNPTVITKHIYGEQINEGK